MSVLWVAEAGSSLPPPQARLLLFQFDDQQTAENISAETIVIPAATRPLQSGFAQHVLNRALANTLLKTQARAVVVCGLYGCTLDLLRVSRLLEIPVYLYLTAPLQMTDKDATTRTVLLDAMQGLTALVVTAEKAPELPLLPRRIEPENLAAELDKFSRVSGQRSWDYALYEFALRDHPLLLRMQQSYVGHFAGCEEVLDVGCGAGVFLAALAQHGIKARGVERDPRIAEYARGMGLDVACEDELEYLEANPSSCDGIYCSHFVEHLPFDAVQRLLALLARALRPGGVLLLVFPNPESLRSQLLGFWRDPEHVRFYHTELIELLALTHGMHCEWSNSKAENREIGPFALTPPPLQLPASPMPSVNAPSWYDRLLRKIGLVSHRRHLHMEQQLSAVTEHMAAQGVTMHALITRTDNLWRVNRPWAWNDDAALLLRKPN
ncbi:MAG: class I SAM-dependent methyltransferase [Thiohalomonadaceae bacterium]